jgi:hypothetical protein
VELYVQILSIVEYEVLLNLVGKSTIRYKLYVCRRHDRSLNLESLEKSTFKSKHKINSVLVLSKYYKVEPDLRNSRNFKLVIYNYT